MKSAEPSTEPSNILRLAAEVAELRRTLNRVVVPLLVLNNAMLMAMIVMLLTGFNLGVSQ